MNHRAIAAVGAIMLSGCAADVEVEELATEPEPVAPEENGDVIDEAADALTCSRLARGAPCSLRCLFENMDCLVRARHPHQDRYPGDGPLTACHQHTGYYSCVYVYPNGDVCTYSHDSMRPPVCVYAR
jgi:hypothetical protein